MRVLHVITALGVGGAENMLLKLLRANSLTSIEQHVVALLPGGGLASAVAEASRTLRELDLLGPLALPRGLAQLASHARNLAPELVQGWMYHGNLGAWVAASAVPARHVPLVWGVRQSLPTLKGENAFARTAIHLNRMLSGQPDVILFNSNTSLAQHRARGFHTQRARVLPNGFDTLRFSPDAAARDRLRRAWGIPEEAVVFGLVARWHPVKNHAGFLQAARQLRLEHPQAHLVLAGTGVDASQPLLAQALRDPALTGALHLLGEQRDIAALMSALDVCVSSSHAEAFSNTLGEAMACALPCVATDVGDSAQVLGGTGLLVPPGDTAALAAAMARLAGRRPEDRAERAARGARARAHVLAHYALESVAQQHAHLWAGLAQGSSVPRAKG
ncbi:MAG: glycosyltransferase [Hydrogenophaga sp.]|jgi:glycosyltransferase involved in cell wall biosynthesis|nr:glycosyltransferase [Hydrogenophaga sp.]